jgi:hypothetical protein
MSMRFRLGLTTGFATGYVLGTKAGKERYEQLRSAWQSLTNSAPAQQVGAEVRGAASRAGDRIEDRASTGVARMTDRVKGGRDADYEGPPYGPNRAPPT